MKRYLIDALVVIGIITLFALNGQGAEPKTSPPGNRSDPTATLLLNQGITQMKEGLPDAARASFALASQLDPKLSIPAVNTRGPDPLRAGSGFAEFGIAGILGFIFVLGMAAYEIGMTSPYAAVSGADRKRSSQGDLFKDERWPAAA